MIRKTCITTLTKYLKQGKTLPQYIKEMRAMFFIENCISWAYTCTATAMLNAHVKALTLM